MIKLMYILCPLLCFAPAISAKPLITSSEETLARICLDGEESPDRLISACNEALALPDITQRQRIELLDALGGALYWEDRSDEAAELYREIIEMNNTSVIGWNGLGWALREIDTDEAAFEAFGRSLEIEPTASGLGGRAGSGYYSDLLGAEEARQMLAAAVAIDAEYGWAIRQIGWIFFDEARYEDALAEFDKALAVYPDDANAFYGKGRAFLKMGLPAEALEMLNQSDAINPMDYWVRTYRVDALLDLDRNAQVVREGDRMIEDFPDRTLGYVQRARGLYRLQRRSDAIAAFQEADEKFGPQGDILYWYADALGEEQRYDEALAVINQALTLDTADRHDHLLKSWIALELEDYEVARASAETSIDIGGDDPWAHYYIAVSMVHGDATQDGMSRFDKAMAFGLPEAFIGYFAKELVRAGKWVEAAQLRIKY